MSRRGLEPKNQETRKSGWIEKYGDDLELKFVLSNEDKKEYLEGLLEKIEVRLAKKGIDHLDEFSS